jgi:hypothetical protein
VLAPEERAAWHARLDQEKSLQRVAKEPVGWEGGCCEADNQERSNRPALMAARLTCLAHPFPERPTQRAARALKATLLKVVKTHLGGGVEAEAGEARAADAEARLMLLHLLEILVSNE